MHCLFGETSSTIADKSESTAPSLGMKERIAARTSYAKRTQLLMRSGLIAGITPTSQRRKLGQGTLDIASSRPDGNDADEPMAD
jgi:hypothetical protein